MRWHGACAASATRNTILVALTGYGRDEDLIRSREAGFDYHFVKPVDFGTLHEVLDIKGTAAVAPPVGKRVAALRD